MLQVRKGVCLAHNPTKPTSKMVISLKPLPEDDDSKAELKNLDISEETEAKADLFWANFK